MTPMRLMFVDDDERVLGGIERTLFMCDRDWEAEFATSGAEALLMLEDDPVDVVISDMRMPMMDGAQFLRTVRDRWPETVRIMLTGQTEQEAALRALDVAQQFLSKPCESTVLVETIDRATSLQSLLRDDSIQVALDKAGQLPPIPTMYARLAHLLENSQARASEVAEVVGADPALAAKVLQLANSVSLYAGAEAGDIAEAAKRIGFRMLAVLVLATEVHARFSGPAAELLRQRSVLASRIAGQICSVYAVRETVMTAALLADVGVLLDGVERSPLGVDAQSAPTHAEIGAYLLGAWGLHGSIVEAVAQHRTPDRLESERFDAVGVVHVAVALAYGEPVNDLFLQLAGVNAHLPAWRAVADALIQRQAAA